MASLVLGVIGAVFAAFALVGFLMFWSQYMQYANCMNGATTAATQQRLRAAVQQLGQHRDNRPRPQVTLTRGRLLPPGR